MYCTNSAFSFLSYKLILYFSIFLLNCSLIGSKTDILKEITSSLLHPLGLLQFFLNIFLWFVRCIYTLATGKIGIYLGKSNLWIANKNTRIKVKLGQTNKWRKRLGISLSLFPKLFLLSGWSYFVSDIWMFPYYILNFLSKLPNLLNMIWKVQFGCSHCSYISLFDLLPSFCCFTKITIFRRFWPRFLFPNYFYFALY